MGRLHRFIRIKKHQSIEPINTELLNNLLNLRYSPKNIIDDDTRCIGIIFSKDRALQLHALLSSYFENVKNPIILNVLYTTSTKEHEQSYQQIRKIFENNNVFLIKEKNFKNQVLQFIRNPDTSKIIFLCDDILFVEPIDLNDVTKYNPLVAIFCLWRGLDSTYCFSHHKYEELPLFIDNVITDSNMKSWIWGNAFKSLDWSYPLSIGANMFSREEMCLLLEPLDFKAPNSLEGKLQKYNYIFKNRYGVCYNKAPVGSIPANIVNVEITDNNITNDLNADELLEIWNQGNRIEYEKYYAMKFNDIQFAKLSFTKR